MGDAPTDPDLLGWVVVVAGEADLLADVARTAMSAGAVVGVVSSSLGDALDATVRFRADPRDPDAWDRIAMHLEQHLGPIDGVVTDGPSAATVQAVFDADLARRGRAPVRVIAATDSAAAIVTGLADTPPTAPSPP